MRGLVRRAAAPSVALLAIASSAIGIFNGFTYDDVYVVEQNPLMKYLHGWWHVFRLSYWPKSAGGDGYRPLTIAESAILINCALLSAFMPIE